MRSLARNKQKIYYSLYVDKEPIYDEYGNQTGEYRLIYGDIKPYEINVSAAQGTSDLEQFGIDLNYSKTMVTNDLNCPINEHTRLWIGKEAIVNNTETPHNYVVLKVAQSINSITYAIKEVSVT